MFGVEIGTWDEDPRRQESKRLVELRFEAACVVKRAAGVGPARSIDAAPLSVRTEDHVRVVGEVLVDLHHASPRVAGHGRGSAVRSLRHVGLDLQPGELRFGLWLRVMFSQLDLTQRQPVSTAGFLALDPALEDENVDDDFGACRRVHAALGEPDRADQIGHSGDVLARDSAGLVHRPGARHENGQPAGTQAFDRARDEVVMQPQSECRRRRIGLDDPICERRIADRQVESVAERAAGVVLAADPRFWVDEPGDPSGNRIVFDPNKARAVAQALRHHREEQAGSHSRLEYPSTGEAEANGGAPDGADDRLRREMRILGCAPKCGVFL